MRAWSWPAIRRASFTRMKGLPCRFVQVDEIWTYVGKKQKRVRPWDSQDAADQFVFVALDADTKLVPSFLVGKRETPSANAFIRDLASRVKDRMADTDLNSADCGPALAKSCVGRAGAHNRGRSSCSVAGCRSRSARCAGHGDAPACRSLARPNPVLLCRERSNLCRSPDRCSQDQGADPRSCVDDVPRRISSLITPLPR